MAVFPIFIINFATHIMKYLIASDIHGSATYCQKLLEAYRREGAGRLLLLGDILYHGPRNALPDQYDAKACIEMLNEFAKESMPLCVRGNCDTEVDQMVLTFPIMADYLVLTEGDTTIFATHGHHYNAKTPLPLHHHEILLCGHTHLPACEDHGDFVYLNPGSTSIPKGGSWHGYMTFDGHEFLWKDLDSGEVKKSFAIKR